MMKAGYAATFASEASKAIRANQSRGAANSIPRHARVAGSPAGNDTSFGSYFKMTPTSRQEYEAAIVTGVAVIVAGV